MAYVPPMPSSSIAHLDVGGFGRFIPEPKSRLGQAFHTVLSGAASLIDRASSVTGIDPSYQELLNRQIESQEQLQKVSLESNIQKSQHEIQMAAIRNVRVG